MNRRGFLGKLAGIAVLARVFHTKCGDSTPDVEPVNNSRGYFDRWWWQENNPTHFIRHDQFLVIPKREEDDAVAWMLQRYVNEQWRKEQERLLNTVLWGTG